MESRNGFQTQTKPINQGFFTQNRLSTTEKRVSFQPQTKKNVECKGCEIMADYLIRKSEKKDTKIKQLKVQLDQVQKGSHLSTPQDALLSELHSLRTALAASRSSAQREREQSLARLRQLSFNYTRLLQALKRANPDDVMCTSGNPLFYYREGGVTMRELVLQLRELGSTPGCQ